MKVNKSITNQSIRAFDGCWPSLSERVYVDIMACVIGKVVISDDVSIWPGVVVRGDVNDINIGARSNIQDNATLHCTHDGIYSPGGFALQIGNDVTVGHAAVLHGCTIGNLVLIGMGSIVLDGAVIEDTCLIGAGAVVSPGTHIPAGQLWVGNPARYKRDLKPEEHEMLSYSAAYYKKLKDAYLLTDSNAAKQ